MCKARGGKPLARGALYLMLKNRIYRSEIVHKDKAYPSLHEAIVHEALWEMLEAALAENRVERGRNQPESWEEQKCRWAASKEFGEFVLSPMTLRLPLSRLPSPDLQRSKRRGLNGSTGMHGGRPATRSATARPVFAPAAIPMCPCPNA